MAAAAARQQAHEASLAASVADMQARMADMLQTFAASQQAALAASTRAVVSEVSGTCHLKLALCREEILL